MRKFLKHIAPILVIIIASSYFLEYIYTYAFSTGFSRNKTQYVIQLKDTHLDYIFLGSSRVENHIDCELITKLTGKSCLNLGIQGSKTKDSAALLQILKSNNVSYNKVFFQLDYAVNFDVFVPAFQASIAPYIKDHDFNQDILSELNLPKFYDLPFIRYASNDKLIGLREVILQYYEKPIKQNLSNGFHGTEGIGKNIKGNLPSNVMANNKGIAWMQKIEPDKLFFFTAPYCKEAVNRDLFLVDLKKKYPSTHSYIDIFDNNEKYYSDCGHLNNQGAQIFTETIIKDLLID